MRHRDSKQPIIQENVFFANNQLQALPCETKSTRIAAKEIDMGVKMDILRVTPIIADMHESGLYATKHSRGDFNTDKERWFAAAADCGIVGDKRIAKCWKLYVKACFIADEPYEENQGSSI